MFDFWFSLLNCDWSDLIPHAWAMKTAIAFVVFEPFVKTMLMELMAALSLYDLTRNRRISTLNTMWTNSLQLILTNWTCLTLRIAYPTCYCVPLYYLENFGVLFLHFSQIYIYSFLFLLVLIIDLSIFYKRY